MIRLSPCCLFFVAFYLSTWFCICTLFIKPRKECKTNEHAFAFRGFAWINLTTSVNESNQPCVSKLATVLQCLLSPAQSYRANVQERRYGNNVMFRWEMNTLSVKIFKHKQGMVHLRWAEKCVCERIYTFVTTSELVVERVRESKKEKKDALPFILVVLRLLLTSLCLTLRKVCEGNPRWPQAVTGTETCTYIQCFHSCFLSSFLYY